MEMSSGEVKRVAEGVESVVDLSVSFASGEAGEGRLSVRSVGRAVDDTVLRNRQ